MTDLNGVSPVLRSIEKYPDRPALIFPKCDIASFGDVEVQATRYQKRLKSYGLKKGDTVLLGETPEPRLFSFVLAALGLGIAVAVIEPWMPLARIEAVVQGLKPKLFLTGVLGRFWGLRVASIRAIPNWTSLASFDTAALRASATSTFEAVSVPSDALGLVAFTSGTTGKPKGVPRRHGYLLHQHRVLSEALHHDKHDRPELTIFTNFVFANLASGRGSVVIPSKWKDRDIRWASSLTGRLQPETATMGPAFLRKLSTETGFEGLRSIHVGGALTDCSIFESAFGRFKDVEFLHCYGSSEAEPVASIDAHEAVDRSRQAGYFQTLALGRPIEAIESSLEASTVWVTGDHVCPLYIGKPEDVESENRENKRKDESGRIWHAMGDRIKVRDGVWWYAGRSRQAVADFELEQRLYSGLGSSLLFSRRNESGALEIYVQGDEIRLSKLEGLLTDLRNEGSTSLAEPVRMFQTEIVRDHRHRARIDRVKSLKKAKRGTVA
jgi:olefin beta-lactone synthetase